MSAATKLLFPRDDRNNRDIRHICHLKENRASLVEGRGGASGSYNAAGTRLLVFSVSRLVHDEGRRLAPMPSTTYSLVGMHLVAPTGVLTQPLAELLHLPPPSPAPRLALLSSLLSGAVASVERVINRATRCRCNAP